MVARCSPVIINSNDSKGLQLAARARHAGVSHARHEQESRSAKVLRWCAARLLLRTLTDEFAFRRISRIDVRVLPIQIEYYWQDTAASTPPPSDSISNDVFGTQERVTE